MRESILGGIGRGVNGVGGRVIGRREMHGEGGVANWGGGIVRWGEWVWEGKVEGANGMEGVYRGEGGSCG